MMFYTPHITIQKLHFSFPTADKALFDALDFDLTNNKVGLVGRNGVGKSTLFKLICGEEMPLSGSINIQGRVGYCPQKYDAFEGDTIAYALGVEEKLLALQRIYEGSIDEADFSIVGDDWEIETRVRDSLEKFELSEIDLQSAFNELSGGQQTRVMLVRTLMQTPDFLLLDEPTNNLDADSRQIILREIAAFDGGTLVISHDRQLLRLMDEIIELTSLGVKKYGGNYDHYIQQKWIDESAAEQRLHAEIQSAQKAKKQIQIRRERHEQNEAKGNRARKAQLKAKGRIDKIAMNSAKGRSERTNRRIKKQASRKLASVDARLKDAKSAMEVTRNLSFSVNEVSVPNNKVIVKLMDVSFSYTGFDDYVFQDINLQMIGPERIAIVGENGSGKTTLLKILVAEIVATSGEVYLGVDRWQYLDQRADIFIPELTVLENFRRHNPDVDEAKSYSMLAQFLFRNEAALKKVAMLSGGELLRLQLACVLMSSSPPQLLILDEPTNHLDLISIEVLEAALRAYHGALIVVSHDQDFIMNVGVERKFELTTSKKGRLTSEYRLRN